jgi:hypothetical protein
VSAVTRFITAAEECERIAFDGKDEKGKACDPMRPLLRLKVADVLEVRDLLNNKGEAK